MAQSCQVFIFVLYTSFRSPLVGSHSYVATPMPTPIYVNCTKSYCASTETTLLSSTVTIATPKPLTCNAPTSSFFVAIGELKDSLDYHFFFLCFFWSCSLFPVLSLSIFLWKIAVGSKNLACISKYVTCFLNFKRSQKLSFISVVY